MTQSSEEQQVCVIGLGSMDNLSSHKAAAAPRVSSR